MSRQATIEILSRITQAAQQHGQMSNGEDMRGRSQRTEDVEDVLNEVFESAMSNARKTVESNEEQKRLEMIKQLSERKKKGSNSVEDAKLKIKTARKEKMRTVSFYLCDSCDSPILQPEDGYIIQGNVYVADAASRGGLIGNAFPTPDEEGKIVAAEIKEIVFCRKCLLSILNMSKPDHQFRGSL